MENKNGNEKFSYSYSAREQEELKRIRQKYMSPTEDKMAQLRRLDASVTRKGTAVSLIVGIVGSLVMGLGMSFVMVWEMMLLGIPVGLVGIGLVAAAYPLYVHITKRERERITPEILRLTDELMK